MLSPYTEQFLEHLTAVRGASAHTINTYRTVLKQLSAYGTPEKLQERDINSHFKTLKKQHKSPQTQAQHHSVLKQFYQFLISRKERADDPMQHIARPKTTTSLPKAPDKGQITTFLESCQGEDEQSLRLRTLATLLYAGGLRISEALSLKVSDIPDAHAQPMLRIMGKRGKTRLVPVGELALETIHQYLQNGRPQLLKEPSEWLFPAGHRGKNQPLSRVRAWQQLKARGEAAGLEDFSPHQLRHACATHMLENEADLRLVQLLLGHADLNTTQIYTKVLREKLDTTLKKHHPLMQKLAVWRKRG